jgi:hypothetical protein
VPESVSGVQILLNGVNGVALLLKRRDQIREVRTERPGLKLRQQTGTAGMK